MTWWGWVLLALAALAVLVLVGLSLWRRVKSLGREVAAAGELSQRLADIPEPEPFTHVPGVVRDPATLAAARATRARVKFERRAVRRARLDRVSARWRAQGYIG